MDQHRPYPAHNTPTRKGLKNFSEFRVRLLHCVRLYLSYAEGKRRFPHQDVQWRVTEDYIRRRVEEKKVCDALIRGGRVLHFMKRNGVEFVRCSAVEVELFRLEAFSCALRTAMGRSRVRGRWFSQFGDEEVDRWMAPQDRESVVSSLDETFYALDSFGIRVSDLDPATASDVVQIARGIMTMVYMDAMDSVVYANALVAAATHLVTSDGRFSNVVNGFKNPCSEGARACSKKLTSLVRACTGMELAYREFPVSQNISRLCP